MKGEAGGEDGEGEDKGSTRDEGRDGDLKKAIPG